MNRYTLILIFFLITFLLQLPSVYAEEWVSYNCVDNICAIAELEDTLWLGSKDEGLVKFNKITGDYVIFNIGNSTLPNNSILSLAIDSSQILWVGTKSGLCEIRSSKWINYPNLKDYDINTIEIDEFNNKWLGTSENGLIKLNGEKLHIYNTSNSGITSNSINAVLIDKTDNLKWLGVENVGVCVYDDYSWYANNNVFNSGFGSVIQIEAENNGTKWLTSQNGLYCVNGMQWAKYEYSSLDTTLSISLINTLCIDYLNTLWMSDSFEGLFRFKNNRWKVYTPDNSNIPETGILSIHVSKDRTVWLGTVSSGIVSFKESVENNSEAFGTVIKENVTLMISKNNGISYTLCKNGKVKMDLCDMRGRILKTYVNDYKNKGTYFQHLNTEKFSNGVYLLRLKMGGQAIAQKINITE